MDGLRLEGLNFSPFLVIKYIKNYNHQNMSIIKVVYLFSYSSMKKNDLENQNCAIANSKTRKLDSLE